MTKSVALGVLLFVAGIVVGRISVLMTQPETAQPQPAALASPHPGPMAAMPAPSPQAGANVIHGEIAEVIQVPQYTYLRLSSGEWAAVPSAPSLAVGQQVDVLAQSEMTNFSSPSLGRTFPKIWFGALEGGAPAAGHPAPSAAPMMPPTAPPEVKAALQAVGSSNALALRVVDVYSERAALTGQRVKVKGTVDRVNLVQGIHYVHLKDGSGAAADKTDDLLCLSTTEVTKGASVTLEGLVALNKDIGMGPVPVVLDQAVVR